MSELQKAEYPVTLNIDYPDKLDRLSSLLRFFWALPILVILGLITKSGFSETKDLATGLTIATALMIIFRQRYPKWWFQFNLELSRFSTRVTAYMLLLTDKYPSTEDEQTTHINIKYPDAKNDLNRLLPLFKWLLVFPHYVILVFLALGLIPVTIVAYLSILFTGKYPRSLFDYVVGVLRWALRVSAYAFLLVTDEYPPFSLK